MYSITPACKHLFLREMAQNSSSLGYQILAKACLQQSVVILYSAGLLKLRASVHLAPTTVPRPVTSLLWAGPCLLALGADGRVQCVTASGG
jgi:hypothetical protein